MVKDKHYVQMWMKMKVDEKVQILFVHQYQIFMKRILNSIAKDRERGKSTGYFKS